MSEQFPGVLVKGKSANRKLGPVDEVKFTVRGGKRTVLKRPRYVPRAPFVASTYLSIQKSCDDSCVFKNGNGCFAESGYTKLMIDRLEEEVGGRGLPNLGVTEARALDTLFPGGVPQDGGRDAKRGRDLRLHVSGDAANDRSARALGGAAERWVERGGGTVWTYTHSWRRIHRDVWGPKVQVLASVETASEVGEARANGYAPALVIREFLSTKVFSVPGTDVRFFPCLAETHNLTCATCRACFDTEGLKKKNLGVAFAVHGRGATKAKKRLPMYNSLFGVLP